MRYSSEVLFYDFYFGKFASSTVGCCRSMGVLFYTRRKRCDMHRLTFSPGCENGFMDNKISKHTPCNLPEHDKINTCQKCNRFPLQIYTQLKNKIHTVWLLLLNLLYGFAYTFSCIHHSKIQNTYNIFLMVLI